MAIEDKKNIIKFRMSENDYLKDRNIFKKKKKIKREFRFIQILGSQKKIKNIWSPTIKRRERKKIIKNETEVKENEEVDHLFENQEILNQRPVIRELEVIKTISRKTHTETE